MLDFPDKTACILWFAGCNMRCAYCYNPSIVLGKGKLGFDEVYRFLDKRVGLLDGVVLSGGECTLHKNLDDFLKELKLRNLLVKVDTNGSHPEVLKTWIANNWVDYVALDFKASKKGYEKITSTNDYNCFEESFRLLNSSKTPFEIRTTLHSDLFVKEDVLEMANYLKQNDYKGVYYLQHALNNIPTLQPLGHSFTLWEESALNAISEIPIKIRN